MQTAALTDTQKLAAVELLTRDGGTTTLTQVCAPATFAMLDATCTARPGLLEDIRMVLKNSKATVVDLASRQFDAPMDSMIVFHAFATLKVTDDCHLDALQNDLESIEPDLIVSISN